MIMIRDNNSQTINSLTISRAIIEDGQLALTTGGRYRFIELTEKETLLVDKAIHEAYKKAASEAKEGE